MNLSVYVLGRSFNNELFSFKKAQTWSRYQIWYLLKDMYENRNGKGWFAFLFVTGISVVEEVIYKFEALFIWI